ncbi:MAG TPA: GAF domain-containing protein [Bacteroidota bacterium]|nr:GAF domain-containing protein [Bacteroidota bacterium]
MNLQNVNQETLHECESKFRAIAQFTPDHVIMQDCELRYTYVVNPQLGLTEEEMIGRTDSDLFPPEEADTLTAVKRQVLHTRASYAFETSIRNRSGEVEYFEGQYIPQFDMNNEVVGLIGYFRNVTNRKRREAVLAIRVRLLRSSARQSLNDVLRTTVDEAEAITGSQIGFFHFVEPDQITISKRIWSTQTTQHLCSVRDAEIHSPVSHAGVWADCIRLRRPVIHNDVDALAHRKGMPEGHVRVRRELVVPIFRSDQIVAVIGVGNKLTGYTKTDIELLSSLADLAWEIVELKRQEDAAKRTESLLRTTQRITHVGGWEWDIEKRTTFWTEETFRVFELDPAGYTPGIPEPVVSDLECFLPEDRRALRAAFERCMSDGRSYDMEVSFTTAKGSRRWVRIFGEAECENGKIVKVAGSVMDITERKQKDQLLHDAQRRESIGILSGGIAHDFNNLLASMMGNVSLAQMHLPDEHPSMKNLAKALSAMERAADLTRQMLAYAGKGKFEIRRIDLTSMVRDHGSLFTVSLPKNVKLTTRIPSHPLCVEGDPGQIEQIFMNLLINGGEAVGERQGAVSIILSDTVMTASDLAPYNRFVNTTLTAGRYVVIEVNDTGSGMDQDTMSKMFDPFFTTKFMGRGLGLAAVLGIIQGHKGGITVDSNCGEGTTIRVVLPAVAAPDARDEANESHDASRHNSVVTILVIDDEEDVATMAKEILMRDGYGVAVKLNPLEGIERFRQCPSDTNLVLLDLTMPEMSGREVVVALQSIDPSVRIIITSGYSEEDVAEKLGDVKVSAFIQKPYRMQLLLSTVREVLKSQLTGRHTAVN